MKSFSEPYLELIYFENVDIVTTSCTLDICGGKDDPYEE